jgi:ABC-type multidrug transport system fused ATPase/permease subunit
LPWIGVVENKFQSLERVHDKIEEIQLEDSGLSITQPKYNYDGPLLEFKNVSMRYPKTNSNVLTNISFQLYQKQKIGIIGR